MTTFAAHVVGSALEEAAALVDPPPSVTVPVDGAEAAVRSERFLRDRGRPLELFAPVSRLWPARDGWVRTHGNYPWHRAALLAALEVRDDAAAGPRIAALDAAEVEARAYAAGALAVRLRTVDEWRRETGLDDPPLVRESRVGEGPVRAPRRLPTARSPLAGVRILDFTRVIAGPTATRFLGALGADVLRLDDPGRPELEAHRLDGLLGKRSAVVRLPGEVLGDLLRGADVVVLGYRPGALDRFGLAVGALAAEHPGLVVVTLDAWGAAAGWEGRRGFDSLVQVATGIAARLAGEDGNPGALPYQALDHGTGYLLAGATCRLLRIQRARGGTWHAALALAHTAAHVVDRWLPLGDDGPAAPPLERHDGLEVVPPPGALDGLPLRWPGPPAAYGAATPRWAE